MARSMTRWMMLALMTGLLVAGCGSEEPVENADVGAIPPLERMPPLHNLDDLVGDAPKNDDLGMEAKSDEIFPAQFDVVDTQSPVQSQGSRGVCSIFSAVALMEHLYIKEGTLAEPNFSEQFLQWSTKVEVGRFTNTSGSNAEVNLQAISDFGVVEEGVWPYESSPWNGSHDETCTGAESQRPVQCFTNGDPTEEMLEAPRYRLPKGRWVSTRTRDLKAYMYNNEQAVVVGGTFFYQSWNHGGSSLPTNSDYWREGYVLYPNAEDREASLANRAGHSVLLTGWEDELEVERLDAEGNVMLDENGEPMTEKGFFIFKNSWGTGGFGVNNPHGDGYGYISYRYVEEFKSARGAGVPEVEHFPQEEELVCAAEELLCEEQCVAVDEQNCGSCGMSCSDNEICDGTQCVVPSCDEENPDCGDPTCLNLPACEGEEVTFESSEEVAIPDNDLEGVTTALEVDGSGLIQGVTVGLFIEHTFKGDIRVELRHPGGDSVVLVEADGAPGLDILENYDTEAFNGLESAGSWELTVIDTANLDEGTLLGWELTILR